MNLEGTALLTVEVEEKNGKKNDSSCMCIY